MKNKPTIQEANSKAVDEFFRIYDEDTRRELVPFLLDMALMFLETTPGKNYTETYLDEVSLHFKALCFLVNRIQGPITDQIEN